MTPFGFNLIATDGGARRGTITTSRGEIRTPAFMPVGTQATVKTQYPQQIRDLGADILLGNTYHLMLRPGAERVARLGGLHSFMNWPYPILTDSGGFQVMSLAKLRKIKEEGVTFQSHIDGSRHFMSPERSVEIQGLLGADIQMQLDECVKLPASKERMREGMELSLRWAERSKAAFGDQPERALFGIVQGGDEPGFRIESARALKQMDFKGYSIGGLAVGEPQETMLAMLEVTLPELPIEKPRYLMGVGKPDDIVKSVARGVDMFDCVLPSRAGRHGLAYTRRGPVNLRNARHAEDTRPLDEMSDCPATRDYSRAYLHHLFKAGETLGQMLLTWNNLYYFQDLMSGLRDAIEHQKFKEHCNDVFLEWEKGDIAPV